MDRTDSSSAMLLLQYGMDDSDEDTSFNDDHPTHDPTALAQKTKSPEKRRASKETSGAGNSQPATAGSPGRRASGDSIGKQSATGLISDEEFDHHVLDRSRKREHDDEDEEEGEGEGVPRKIMLMDVSHKMAPSVSPVDVDSNASFSDSQQGKEKKKSSKPATMRLVSYLSDEHDEDDEEENQNESDEESNEEKDHDVTNVNPGASPSHQGKVIDTEDIQLPPEPPGKCSKALQEKITKMYNRMKHEGFDSNHHIQGLTSFRNPSIYEKLIQTYHIDEKGSNFKLNVFNPLMWGKDSLYDELDKVQKKDMERREKERKTKIEFVSGTKKSALPSAEHSHAHAYSHSAAAAEEKKRKSKWDALPPGLPSSQSHHHHHHHHRSSSSNNNSNPSSTTANANLTTTATGTRATVISAVGTLTKKAPYNVINSSS